MHLTWRTVCAMSAVASAALLLWKFTNRSGTASLIHSAGCSICDISSHAPQLPDGWDWDTYHSHDELVKFVTWINKTYPTVARSYSIGQSVQGRQLLAVELRGRPIPYPFWRKKPKVKLIGNIHGNEQAIRELLLRLLHYLASGYRHTHRVTQLLDSVNIHILPSMNPDGYTADTRVNANGYDLNRNFPLDSMPYDAPGPAADNDSETVKSWRATGAGKVQPEVAAVMDWSKQHDFVLSASLHQGALVANYPHDACDTQGLLRECPTQDDPLPLFLAQVYAQNHQTMKLNNNGSFVNGTVQGAQWYTLLGGMQDWVFFDRRSLELTMELHPAMRPPPEELPALWQHNLPALMRFTEMAQMGLHGRLVDAETFMPLQGTVMVNTPEQQRPTYVNNENGEFFMLLAPDVLYCLTIYATDAHSSYQHKYHAIHVAVLRMGASKVIHGSGTRSLTARQMFFAERADDAKFVHSSVQHRHNGSQSSTLAATRRLGAWPAHKMVCLGDARESMCPMPRASVLEHELATL